MKKFIKDNFLYKFECICGETNLTEKDLDIHYKTSLKHFHYFFENKKMIEFLENQTIHFRNDIFKVNDKLKVKPFCLNSK